MLNNLAAWHVEAGEPEHVLDAFANSWADLTSGPRAELAVARSRWRASQHDAVGAAQDLHTAAGWAQQETEPRWAGRSRRAVRDAVAALLSTDGSTAAQHPDLPEWAWRPLSDNLVATFNQWIGAAGWDEHESLLRAHPALRSEDGREALRVTRALYPEIGSLAQLAAILDTIAVNGLDEVLAELRAAHEHADLLRQWLAAETWPESRDFLHNHLGLLARPPHAAHPPGRRR